MSTKPKSKTPAILIALAVVFTAGISWGVVEWRGWQRGKEVDALLADIAAETERIGRMQDARHEAIEQAKRDEAIRIFNELSGTP